MGTGRDMIALLRSHAKGDDGEFYARAMQVAAREARLGHRRLAAELKTAIDEAKAERSRGAALLVMQPRPELAGLVSISTPGLRLAAVVLPRGTRERLQQFVIEQKQSRRLRERGLRPRSRLLLLGPPGTGKTMTAGALAGELHLPLLTVLLEGVITKFMGESAAKLRLIFDAMAHTSGVYLFDEFDAIGSRRDQRNDVGEVRRILNSFLQMMDSAEAPGLIIAATNHPDLLDPALFRRFDDVVEYGLPSADAAWEVVKSRLAAFPCSADLTQAANLAAGLSQADIARACDEAAKRVVLNGAEEVRDEDLRGAIEERRHAYRPAPAGGRP
ncbi:MAG: AAA family ATPase [Terriglobales bacterium]